MIATRRPRRNLHLKRYFNLLVFGIVIYELYSVPLTHKVIFDGPLKPFWMQVGGLEKKFVAPVADPVIAPLVRPLNFAMQQRALADDSRQLMQAKTSAQAAAAMQKADAKKISDLQHQLDAKNQAAAAPGVAAAGTTAGAAGATVVATPSAPVTPSPDDMKNAAYWASMEPETAAQIAQHLAPADTARVFLAMKPDQVAEIMNTLPTAYNVQLKAVHLDGTASP